MKHSTPLAWIVASTLGATTAGDALSYETGDIVVRAGIASVRPNEDSDRLKLNGAPLAGTGAGTDSNEQLGLTLTYMFAPHWAVGVLAATPFEHDVNVRGLGLDAGSIKHLPPTVTVQYFPLDSASRCQPYVGIGVNYTLFFDEEVDGDLEALFGPGDLKLDNSWGFAAEAGIDYLIGDHWLLNAAVWYLDIDTEATFRFTGNKITTGVEIDPWVYMLGVGYRF